MTPYVSMIAMLLLVVVACDGGEPSAASNAPATSSTPANAAPSNPAPAVAEAAVVPAATQESVQRAIGWLESRVRTPAGDPNNPWALAHGLLAFGRDFKTSDGRSAVEVIATFAEHDVATDRYGFAPHRQGTPVEPHPYLLAKTFLEIGLDPSFALRTADGTTIDVRRLLTDMRARVHAPTTDTEWHDSAWWLTALELDPASELASLKPLRDAALQRLEADDAVITGDATNAFASDAPMGLAKRNKSQIYGHPCGGLHFMQAVLRGARNNTSGDYVTRASRQVRLLVDRYRAERALYVEILKARPSASLLISVQQLKFYGHVLETLAVADEVGLLRQDLQFAADVNTVRQQVATDLLVVIAQLDSVAAYSQLDTLATQQHQLMLDLIGDGCHALHGLRVTLPALPAQ